jgi:hypothetical protein
MAWTVGSAVAAEIENVQFVEGYRLGDVMLPLNNVGLMRHKGLIKAMVAGLYIQDGTPPDRVLSDVSKRLEIEYFWSLKGAQIVKASEKLLSDNVDNLTLQRLKPQFDRMHALYEDVVPGDRYALTYVPGHGTSLSLNGDIKGTVPGADFAASYFSIWLGRQPMNVSLKRQLLRTRR